MKNFVLAAMMAVASVLTLSAAPAEAQTPTPSLTIPISGTGDLGTFAGTFELQRFTVVDGAIAAVGRLTGTLTNTATGVVTSIVRTITLPVSVGAATCEILHLELGPLELDLLGLQIDLSRIVLDITAQSGAGNLLGNLLCSVAGLLDNPGGLAKLLNQILAILG
jgi:hypothetical protein